MSYTIACRREQCLSVHALWLHVGTQQTSTARMDDRLAHSALVWMRNCIWYSDMERVRTLIPSSTNVIYSSLASSVGENERKRRNKSKRSCEKPSAWMGKKVKRDCWKTPKSLLKRQLREQKDVVAMIQIFMETPKMPVLQSLKIEIIKGYSPPRPIHQWTLNWIFGTRKPMRSLRCSRKGMGVGGTEAMLWTAMGSSNLSVWTGNGFIGTLAELYPSHNNMLYNTM